ncbi:MAG: hypothetical protein PHU62_03505 [Bacteroidales bacterium]|jgi:hypothetical protein|nr:hypothetical protein [Bacteroidales bacterium]MDD2204224.1 hypothetical protein [Bacteroidales bacterium]MDD3913603.1 hypothetical protein [Bacteroidales bacterium]MDD4633629.1 hypothetical protein [Bacteroidales bacterium]
MIEIQHKIHDNYSIEFKIGFVVRRSVKDNYFSINSWIFIPNSLDINPSTYGKDQFYRDVKSNVRLITPVFLLRDIAQNDAIPYQHIKTAFETMASNPLRSNIAEYIHQIKMFMAITKSALRDEAKHIQTIDNINDIKYLCNNYLDVVSDLVSKYRNLRQVINVPTVTNEVRNHFAFGDEYMSQIINIYFLKIIDKMNNYTDDELFEIKKQFVDHLKLEDKYRKSMGYLTVDVNDADANKELLFRHGLLKKYIENDLFVKLDKKEDGAAVRQLLYGVAAGFAMIIATVVAFPFQKTLSNYSILLFIVLVISYMLKDRIKELMRYFFAHKLKNKYYDHKANIHIKDTNVGWIKEGVDFITDEKTPKQVLALRNRSSLLQAENDIFDEKITLYRKKVYIDNDRLSGHYEYRISGINDIIRLHINRFTQKMDNPEVPIETITEDGKVCSINGLKTYNLNIIMQFQYEDNVEYKGFRIIMSRDGIIDIRQL